MEAVETSAHQGQRFIRLFGNVDTEQTEAQERRPAVRARRESGQARATVGQGGDDSVAMRNGFVAGHAQVAADASSRGNGGGGHLKT